MSSAKFSDLIKQYDGSGDFCEWLKKLELVCKLQKVKDLETVLPLFLSDGAFAVYDGLTEDSKNNYVALTQALQHAFSVNSFQAYEQFISRRLLPGESVDVYVSELKRLAKLVDPFVSDEWIKNSMVHGLPLDVQNQLRAACCLQDLALSKVIERARSLVTGSETVIHGAVAKPKGERFNDTQNKTDRRRCFVCKKEGHVALYCPQKKVSSNVTCYCCGEVGHYASNCHQTSKNE
jgi:hypothetical protein